MSSIHKSVNVERRTWDKEAFEARAKSRAAAAAAAATDGEGQNTNDSSSFQSNEQGGNAEIVSIKHTLTRADNDEEEKEEFLPAQQGRAGPMGSQRAYLKSRSNKIDLESKLGSTEIIDPAAASATRRSSSTLFKNDGGVSKCSDGVGWYCRVCDCFLKDSLTYLDHINGKKHNRYLGYTMRVEKSTVEEVSGVLKTLAEKKQTNDEIMQGGGLSDTLNFEDVVRMKDEEALRRKAERARRKEERRRKVKEDESNGTIQEDLLDKINDGTDVNNDVEDEQEVDEVEAPLDSSIEAMMGFSGFSGRRK